jgi:hypothetical protein
MRGRKRWPSEARNRDSRSIVRGGWTAWARAGGSRFNHGSPLCRSDFLVESGDRIASHAATVVLGAGKEEVLLSKLLPK